jgi:WXG100 family type VII secretion target
LGVVVDQKRLDSVAAKAREVGEGITLNLARLLNEIETQAPGFRGHAGRTFTHITDALSDELKSIIEHLNRIAEQIDGANRDFGTTDADAAAEINAVVHEYLPGSGPVADQLRGGTG